jgi:hypothetical protein
MRLTPRAQGIAAASVERSTVHGSVTAASTEQVLSFALVAIPTLGLERFASERGQFTFLQIPADTYRIRVRQLGYDPFETELVVKGGTTSEVVVRMARIAQMQVESDWRCENPGRHKATNTKAVAMFEQMEQNAEHMRLLREQYPFIVYVDRGQLMVRMDGSDSTIRRDTMLVRSDSQTKYAPGNVVYNRDENRTWEYFTRIPTWPVFADEVFENNHGFVVRGIDKTKDKMPT